jgi:hypothetical protein
MVPKLTNDLQEVIFSKGRDLLKTCTLLYPLSCQQLDRTACYALPTSIPSSLLSNYSSFASAASSWWFENKPAVLSIAEECPQGWQWYATTPKQAWLNNNINFGECYDRVHQTKVRDKLCDRNSCSNASAIGDQSHPRGKRTDTFSGIRSRNNAGAWMRLTMD